MATSKMLVFPLVVVVSSFTVFAQESIEPVISKPSPAPGIFDNFPLKPPSFDLHALWPHLAAYALDPQHKRSIEEDSDTEDHPRAKRRVVTCNFLTQGGFRCTTCRNISRCYPFNVGTITTCGGLFPYCNNGVCSSVKGSLCFSTTSTSTAIPPSITPTSTSTSTSDFTSGSNFTSDSNSTTIPNSTSSSNSTDSG